VYKIPAKAGTHQSGSRTAEEWIPAFAGKPQKNRYVPAGEIEAMPF
jgi:hypothetical protein